MRAATNVSVAGGCHRPRLTLRYVVLGGLFAHVAARNPTKSWALLLRFLFARLPAHGERRLAGLLAPRQCRLWVDAQLASARAALGAPTSSVRGSRARSRRS